MKGFKIIKMWFVKVQDRQTAIKRSREIDAKLIPGNETPDETRISRVQEEDDE